MPSQLSRARPDTYLQLEMRLPRQAASVTKARHTVEHALTGIGVIKQCRDDIALALSEACGNAVEHAKMGQAYDVIVTVGRTRCVVDVVDTGVGMDLPRPDGGSPGAVTTERGRGLHLIRAVTDGLEMHRVDPHGLAVSMIKILTWARDASAMWAGVDSDPWTPVPSENRSNGSPFRNAVPILPTRL
jgi:serine/threonine-protein kinase RsbW